MERTGMVSFQGNALTLTGDPVEVGRMAPDFTVLDNAFNPVKLSDFRGRIVIISAVPSLDTPVCELQTIRFNQEAAGLDAKLLTVSMDLPFAQARFCDSHKIGGAQTLSDFRDREFAMKYGLYLKELGLIARSVLIVDRDGLVAYLQIVPDISSQPEYDDVLLAARKLGA